MGGGPSPLPGGVTSPRLGCENAPASATEDRSPSLSDGQNKHALSRSTLDMVGLAAPSRPRTMGLPRWVTYGMRTVDTRLTCARAAGLETVKPSNHFNIATSSRTLIANQ